MSDSNQKEWTVDKIVDSLARFFNRAEQVFEVIAAGAEAVAKHVEKTSPVEAEARIFGGCGVPAAKMLTKTEMFAAIEKLPEPMRSRARASIGRELLLKEYGIDLDEERQKMLEEQAWRTAKAAAQAAPLILNVPWGYPLVDFELPVSSAARKWIDQHFCSALEGYNLFLEGQEFRDEVARAVDMVKNQLAPEISAVKRIWPEVPLCIIRKAAAWVDAHPDAVQRGAFPLAMCTSTRRMIDAIIEYRANDTDGSDGICKAVSYSALIKTLYSIRDKDPWIGNEKACDPSCPGWAVFVSSLRGPAIEKCDACARFKDDEEALQHALALLRKVYP